jgi:protein phosphatase
LWRAIRAANDDVRALAAERGSGYMATTLVAAHFRDSAMLVANVGDSRCYHWREGVLRQVTKDQSLVAKLLEEGAITEEEALVHPRRNVILSSLGSSREPQIDFYTEQFEANDKVLLCSDGLIRYVTDAEIATLLGDLAVDEATRTLVDLANERGGSDNITVTLLEWMTEAQAIAPQAEATPGLVVSAEKAAEEQMPAYGLWVYTIFLALVECILILLIWWALRVYP